MSKKKPTKSLASQTLQDETSRSSRILSAIYVLFISLMAFGIGWYYLKYAIDPYVKGSYTQAENPGLIAYGSFAISIVGGIIGVVELIKVLRND